MILDDEQLHQAQSDIQKMWRFLEAARRTHSTLDYERLAAPYLLQIQQRQQEILEYLSTKSEEMAVA
ncbi:hypothetical protein L0337_28150 [candidate division KSB1 bacterium]|nr:hypothetical protein [candidate division KSB1 bacterium]